ncbi:jg6759, partial [Pararge aegeria aegeria]
NNTDGKLAENCKFIEQNPNFTSPLQSDRFRQRLSCTVLRGTTRNTELFSISPNGVICIWDFSGDPEPLQDRVTKKKIKVSILYICFITACYRPT